MPQIINTNIMSLMAQRNLNTTQGQLQTALERLSSGLRINSAKDDAAGFYTSQLMTQDINGMNQSIRNANDGVSLAQTGGAAMSEITNDLQRLNELAVQSANGTVQDRSGLQSEADQLTQEISQIVQTSKFAGVHLLNSSASVTFQVGQDGSASNQISVNGIDLTGLNSYSASLTATGRVDISSASAASAAISSIQGDIKSVAKDAATFGAIQNRFQAVISNLTSAAQSLTSARSRITDANFASETAKLSRAQILQQAGVSMVAQANQQPQVALALLR